MSHGLILQRNTLPINRPYTLARPVPGQWGTDFEPIMTFSAVQAEAIAWGHPEISCEDFPQGEPGSPSVKIERVPDREPMKPAWRILINNEVATACIYGRQRPCDLRDESVRWLEKLTSVEFEPGEPDWDRRQIEDLEDQAYLLREQLAATEEKIATAKLASRTSCQ